MRVALGVAVASAVWLFACAAFTGKSLFPRWHDEFSYLIQARMIAAGRLWMPAVPLPDFFDSFYLLCRPKYASMYFPARR